MQAMKIEGQCQRPGCEKHDTILFRVEGEAFAADQERGLGVGYRLYCGRCASGIMRAADVLATA